MITHPIAILGAGPVGLAAAAQAASRELAFILLEKGAQAGASVSEWGHVRVFSPWRYNIDAVARDVLVSNGWTPPQEDYLPTGAELVHDYLAPLAAHPAIAPNLHTNARVEAITRLGHSKLMTKGREDAPFVVHWRNAAGQMQRTLASTVIDATGTWGQPNPIGHDGLPVEGETDAKDRIAYGIPDVLGAERSTYSGRHTLVIGAGHSAINAVLDLMDLQESEPATKVSWATRGGGIARLLGGGLNDALPGRGKLGLRAEAAIRSGRLTLLSPFAVDRIARDGDMLIVEARHAGNDVVLAVDRIIVATGLRPDLSPLRELRLTFDPIVEAPPALAPLIDPNLHSCGTVPPHGVVELAHPEPGFYIVGMKSYGRAPTFLMATGYEQVRSVVAELAGDHVAARQVHLELPETGVCSADPVLSNCCGGPAIQNVDACCANDEAAKADGKTGCGCSTTTAAIEPTIAACCGRAA